jgi:hypothetical protein
VLQAGAGGTSEVKAIVTATGSAPVPELQSLSFTS